MTAIFYYSLTGTTKYSAEYLGKQLDAEVIRLVDQKNLNGTAVKTHEYSSLANNPWEKLEGHEKIILMAPIWGFGVVPAMYTFIEKADLTGKSVLIGCTSFFGEFSAKAATAQYAEMAVKVGGKVLGNFYVKGGGRNFHNEAKLRRRVDKIFPAVKAMI